MDIVSIGFSPSPERIVVLDFSAPLIMQPNRLVVPFPKESNRLLGPILPFQPTVKYYSHGSQTIPKISFLAVQINKTKIETYSLIYMLSIGSY